MTSLSSYPKLASWYESSLKTAHADGIHDATRSLCQAMLTEPHQLTPQLRVILDALYAAQDPTTTYLDLLNFLAYQGLELEEHVSQLVEKSILQLDSAFLMPLEQLSELSARDPLKFLLAWSLFNLDHFQKAIAVCERLTQPTSQVYCLQGQAQLESGQLSQAIESLQIATHLNPKDLLAWFQLAKAFHIRESYEKAWHCLEKCRLYGGHPLEIWQYQLILCLDWEQLPSPIKAYCQSQLRSKTQLQELKPHYAAVVIRFILKHGDEEDLVQLCHRYSLGSLLKAPEVIQELPETLRHLKELDWHKGSEALLTQLTQPNA